MNKPKKSGVYVIKNKVNNKRYIGGSNNIYGRIKEHATNLEKGRAIPPGMLKDYKVFGAVVFKISILDFCSPQKVCFLENHYMNLYDTLNPDKGYNIRTANKNDHSPKGKGKKKGVPKVVIRIKGVKTCLQKLKPD